MLEIKGQYCKDIKIFTDNIEEEALSTIYKMAESMAYKNKKIRIMPDVHQGKGCVIGFSCPIDVKYDFVSPEVVGCDLGCTISAVFFDKGLTAGVYTTTADASTLDEAPQVYKPMEEIVKYIEPTVNILYFMKPMMNIKASDTKEDED